MGKTMSNLLVFEATGFLGQMPFPMPYKAFTTHLMKADSYACMKSNGLSHVTLKYKKTEASSILHHVALKYVDLAADWVLLTTEWE